MTTEVNINLLIVLILNNHPSQDHQEVNLLVCTAFFFPLSCQSSVPELYYKKRKVTGIW